MPLDPQIKMVLDYMAQAGTPDLSQVAPQVAREMATRSSLPPGPPTQIEDRRIPGPGPEIPIRIFRPLDATGTLGAVVYFHGGGFVLGEMASHDAVCQQLAVDAGCAVISVRYRLAPEDKFPSAVDDSYAATCWVHANAAALGIDERRIAVGGDSAGGNLATVVARLAKERGSVPLVFQLLLYPVTDMRSFETVSYVENAEGKYLTRATMIWFASHYVRTDADRNDPRVSPLAAKELAGLPPALIITPEYDPLRDEGAAYAEALHEAGVTVTLSPYPGMIHGFINMYSFVPQGRQAIRESADALVAAFRDA